uniref:Uncharacterized protein n=1 Tax=Electrophorus electricus TaxID=8005 RepID=A0A4W4G5Z6_ELEEL
MLGVYLSVTPEIFALIPDLGCTLERQLCPVHTNGLLQKGCSLESSRRGNSPVSFSVKTFFSEGVTGGIITLSRPDVLPHC